MSPLSLSLVLACAALLAVSHTQGKEQCTTAEKGVFAIQVFFDAVPGCDTIAPIPYENCGDPPLRTVGLFTRLCDDRAPVVTIDEDLQTIRVHRTGNCSGYAPMYIMQYCGVVS